jgi:hypothetical protein
MTPERRRHIPAARTAASGARRPAVTGRASAWKHRAPSGTDPRRVADGEVASGTRTGTARRSSPSSSSLRVAVESSAASTTTDVSAARSFGTTGRFSFTNCWPANEHHEHAFGRCMDRGGGGPLLIPLVSGNEPSTRGSIDGLTATRHVARSFERAELLLEVGHRCEIQVKGPAHPRHAERRQIRDR